MNPISQMYQPTQNNEIIHQESTQNQPYTSQSKPSQLQCPKRYCYCLLFGCPLPVS